jgi:hypothetical protein
VADGPSGLQVIDVSNPASPAVVGSCGAGWYAVDVAVNGSYAYVAATNSGMQVVDISDPAHPVVRGSCNVGGFNQGVEYSGGYVLLADGYDGVKVIDVSNPASPVVVGSQSTPRAARRSTVFGPRVYLACSAAGLVTLYAHVSPTVTAITPSSGANTGSIGITDLSGTGFEPATTVKLTRTGQPDISGTGVSVVSPTMITCQFDLAGKQPGLWDVVVTNTDSSSGTLEAGFAIVLPESSKLYGTSCKSLSQGIIAATLSQYRFRVWGRVTIVDAGRFTVDDGSGAPVTVVAPGYQAQGIDSGDFVSAWGTLDLSGGTPILCGGGVREH